MAAKFKIVIVGLGGVGGFIGGKLGAHYSASGDVEVIFVVRGENEEAINKQGLRLITPGGTQTVHPSFAGSDPKISGSADLVICCMKSYDLESALEGLRPYITKQTLILPLLNGVDAPDRIRKLFPHTEVWNGCIYIVSRLIAPGVVKVNGDLQALYFGSESSSGDQLNKVQAIFESAGIHAIVADNIIKTIWEKFLFISPLATLTSYINGPVGEIVSNAGYKKLFLSLLEEVRSVADAKGIFISEDIIQKILDRLVSLPYENTSSMHSDFQKEGRTEVESLTGYVVRQGKDLQIPTPCYDKLYAALLLKSKTTVA